MPTMSILTPENTATSTTQHSCHSLRKSKQRESWRSRAFIASARDMVLKMHTHLLHTILSYSNQKVIATKYAFNQKKNFKGAAWMIAHPLTEQWTSTFTLHHTNYVLLTFWKWLQNTQAGNSSKCIPQGVPPTTTQGHTPSSKTGQYRWNQMQKSPTF